MKTLIVEDDFTSRLLLQTCLARHGECHIAVNGREGLEAFTLASQSGAPYDLVCMDILMPGMDGKEAVKHLRAYEESHGVLSSAGAKIIMTTAVEDFAAVMESFQQLCDAYLFKPIDVAKLMHELKTLKLVA